MKKHSYFIRVLFALSIVVSLLSGCGEDGVTSESIIPGKSTAPSDGKKRESALQILSAQQTGAVTYGNEIISIDASNTAEGYVMVMYSGSAEKVKLQITIPDSTVYTYTLKKDSYETFPLTGGNGSYHMDILENVKDDLYALTFSQDLDVAVSDEFKPFLYPNQYVWFTEESKAVKLGRELSDQSSDDLSYVQNVYRYVTENVKYDDALAENIPTDYLPNLDTTIDTGKGICFDYASLMAAMLRSQSIPTRLEVGYSGEAYHAWVSVYLKEIGWVDKIIEFDGQTWSLVDPTLAANNNKRSVKKYIGDGSNYVLKYSY